MKKAIFITSLLCAFLMLTSTPKVDMNAVLEQTQETVVKAKSHTTEMNHRVEFLGKDTRGGNVLTARRSVQILSCSSETRSIGSIVRITQDIRIKGAERLQKISEFTSRLQTINYSALLTRKGYHVYALREIII